MENKGWISIHRKIEDNRFWLLEPFTKGQAWVDLILLANHQDGFIEKRGITIPVKRGQVGWSEISLAKRWRWSRNKLRRFLRTLKTEQQIEQQTNKICSLITIINYNHYQINGTTNDTTDGTTKGQQKDNRRNTNNKNNNENNENKKKDTNVSSSKKTSTNDPLKKEFELLVESYKTKTGRRIYSIQKHFLKYRTRRKTFEAVDLSRALDIMLKDDWLQGGNPNGKIYGDLEYLLRNDGQVEKFLNNQNAAQVKKDKERVFKISDKVVSREEFIAHIKRNNTYHKEFNPNGL